METYRLLVSFFVNVYIGKLYSSLISLLEDEARGIALRYACLVLTLHIDWCDSLINLVLLHHVAVLAALLALVVGCVVRHRLLSRVGVGMSTDSPKLGSLSLDLWSLRLNVGGVRMNLLNISGGVNQYWYLRSSLVNLRGGRGKHCSGLSNYLVILSINALTQTFVEKLCHQSRSLLSNVVDLIDVLPVVVYRDCSVNLVSIALLGLTTFKMIEVRVYRNVALTVLDFLANLPIRILALL